MNFCVLPEGLMAVRASLDSIAANVCGVQSQISKVSNGLEAVGLGELDKNIEGLYTQVGKEKQFVDILSDTLVRICQKYEQVEAMLANQGSNFDMLVASAKDKYIGDFNGNLGWNIGNKDAMITEYAEAAMTMGIGVPVSSSLYHDFDFHHMLEPKGYKVRINFENSDVDNGYFALKSPVPMSKFDFEAMPNGWREVIKNGQVVGYQIDKELLQEDVFANLKKWETHKDGSIYNVSYWDDENMGLAELHKQVSSSKKEWDITNNMTLNLGTSQSVSDIYRYPGSEESLNGSMELSYTASQLDLSTATNVGWLGLSAGVDGKMVGVDSVLGASAGWENANGEFDPHFCLGAYASGSLLEAGAHGSVSVAGVDFEMSVSTGVSASVGAYVTYHDGNIQAHFMDADFKIALNEHTDAFEHLIYDMRPTSFDDYLFIEGVKTDLADICYFAAGLSESQ